MRTEHLYKLHAYSKRHGIFHVISDVVNDLHGKRTLVKGYVADNLYVFAKHPVSKAVLKANRDAVFMPLEEMYGEKIANRA